jgi:hypothetical protein
MGIFDWIFSKGTKPSKPSKPTASALTSKKEDNVQVEEKKEDKDNK